ncbi:unnamed protein product [Oikopleura dioica]|uniref:E3 ubiquitin-protein ligase n=1 Tax=Oikopleura dioica TaxID=34765 RepID=E4YWL1_OIKDI|nr:unnamed protein product [Oikopleura dioica]
MAVFAESNSRQQLHQLSISIKDATLPRQKTFVLISADPHAYCEVKVNSSAPTNLSRKTKIHPPSLNPRFNEDLVLLVRKSDVLSFQVWNFRKTGRDVLIGECTLDISKKLDESDGEFASTPFQLSLEDALKVKIGELNINLTGFEKPINDADNNTELAVNEIEDLLINDTVSQNVSSTSSLQIPSSSADPPRAGASFGIAYINNKFPARDRDPTLPQGWEQRFDPQGRRYYENHNARTTQWERPIVLPSGWERRIDNGRVYYVDHNTQTTSWGPPQVGAVQDYSNRMNLAEGLNRRPSRPVDNAQDDNLGPLPENWERRWKNNRFYFINHKTKTTQWEDPRIQGRVGEGPLPDGWDMATTEEGVRYFIDHKNKTTTFQDPREGSSESQQSHGKKSFKWKYGQFRYLCQSNAMNQYVKINVRRQNVFADSFLEIMKIPAHDLRRRLYIHYKGEEGLDYGGVAREWFFMVSREVLNPNYGLFKYMAQSNYQMEINPASKLILDDHLRYFQFFGRFIAMALYHGKLIDTGFSLPFYKKMLRRNLCLRDIKLVDEEWAQTMTWVRDNDLEEYPDLEMWFSTDQEILGEIESVDLKEGGSEIRNNFLFNFQKLEYIQLMIDWRFTRGVKEQSDRFLEGFSEVIPIEWLQYFDERELEMMLCGIHKIDIDDWKRNYHLKNYTASSKQIIWFWEIVREFSDDDQAKLLSFVTGTCRLPHGGFEELIGSNGPQKFVIEKVGKDDQLPRSHTCFNRLDLPPYKSKAIMKEKLLLAIRETEGFGQE